MFAAPFGDIAFGEGLGQLFDTRIKAIKCGVGVVAGARIRLDRETEKTVAALDDGIFGNRLEIGNDLHQRDRLGESIGVEPGGKEGVRIAAFRLGSPETDVY